MAREERRGSSTTAGPRVYAHEWVSGTGCPGASIELFLLLFGPSVQHGLVEGQPLLEG